jgi:hypothetical protein
MGINYLTSLLLKAIGKQALYTIPEKKQFFQILTMKASKNFIHQSL